MRCIRFDRRPDGPELRREARVLHVLWIPAVRYRERAGFAANWGCILAELPARRCRARAGEPAGRRTTSPGSCREGQRGRHGQAPVEGEGQDPAGRVRGPTGVPPSSPPPPCSTPSRRGRPPSPPAAGSSRSVVTSGPRSGSPRSGRPPASGSSCASAGRRSPSGWSTGTVRPTGWSVDRSCRSAWTPPGRRRAAAPARRGGAPAVGPGARTGPDGGWWVLTTTHPGQAAVLAGVPMSDRHRPAHRGGSGRCRASAENHRRPARRRPAGGRRGRRGVDARHPVRRHLAVAHRGRAARWGRDPGAASPMSDGLLTGVAARIGAAPSRAPTRSRASCGGGARPPGWASGSGSASCWRSSPACTATRRSWPPHPWPFRPARPACTR